MNPKILWQCAAILLFSFIFPACKKDINQTEKAHLIQDDGSATTLGITCISNGIQFFKSESLSQAREFPLGIGLTNKVLFVGGFKQTSQGSVASEHVDIYNTSTDSWTDKILSERKENEALAAAGTKIGIAGGDILNNNGPSGPISDQVDIYDVNSDTWTVSQLSTRRSEAAGVGYGDFLYFAGGIGNSKAHKTIDVYNTLNGSWTQLSLSLARYSFAAAATNNKILFAGGETEFGDTDRVDIYDVPTGTWSISALSASRSRLVGAALGNLIIFGGGSAAFNGTVHSYDNVDIYNTSTGQWSVSHISSATGWQQSAVQGTKMFFSGPNSVTSDPSTVDVYDICSNTWSQLSLTDRRGGYGAGAAGGKVLFGGGKNNNFTLAKRVDIFNLGPLIAQ